MTALMLGALMLHAAHAGQVASQARPYEELICSYPDWDCGRVYRIAQCESTMNPNAYAAGNYGLLQINAIHAGMVGGDPTAFYDPETNVWAAHQLWLARGYRPWGYCGGTS